MSSEDMDNMNNESACANGEASDTPPNGVADEQLPPPETDEQLPPPQTDVQEEASENADDTRPVVELFVKVRFTARHHLCLTNLHRCSTSNKVTFTTFLQSQYSTNCCLISVCAR